MGIQVEIFSAPGCSRCGRAKRLLRDVARTLGEDRITWREVDVLEELDYAVDLGVLSTPAIAIDGELVFTGLPSARGLREALVQRLSGAEADDRT